jgi:hypothetical protein
LITNIAARLLAESAQLGRVGAARSTGKAASGGANLGKEFVDLAAQGRRKFLSALVLKL